MMTRLRFILTSTIIVTTTLALVYVAETMAGYRQELKAEIEAERGRLVEVEREKTELACENLELRQTLQNRTMTLSRSGRTGGFQDMPVMTPSGLDAAFFEDAFADTGLAGIGEALVAAETATGISALVLAAICAHESGWGRSKLARDKGNLAGLGAYDGQEYSAGIAFDSQTASIMFLAELLATKYCPGGCYYGGSFDLEGVGVRYASDPGWAEKVAGCVKKIVGGSHVYQLP